LVKFPIRSLMQLVTGGPGSEIPLPGARSDFVAEVDFFCSNVTLKLKVCRFMTAGIRQAR
jgi:hypothetical protein